MTNKKHEFRFQSHLLVADTSQFSEKDSHDVAYVGHIVAGNETVNVYS